MTPIASRPVPRLPTVMIVEDSPELARALAILVGKEYQTAVYHTGRGALEYAREHSCAAALVDVHLPDMNGLLVSQKLRESFGPRTPIVVVSGDTSMGVLNSLPHVGATHFFSKPVNAAYLLDQLRDWIAEAGADAVAG